MLASNAALARRLVDLEKRYDTEFKVAFDAIRLQTTDCWEPQTAAACCQPLSVPSALVSRL